MGVTSVSSQLPFMRRGGGPHAISSEFRQTANAAQPFLGASKSRIGRNHVCARWAASPEGRSARFPHVMHHPSAFGSDGDWEHGRGTAMARSGSAGQPRALSVVRLVVAALIVFTDLPAAAGDNAIFSGLEPNWTGAYVGGHVGAAWGRSDWSASEPAFPQNGTLGLGDPFDFATGTGSYFEGLQTGYNFELPSGVVIGAQADVSFPNTLLGTQTIAAAGLRCGRLRGEGAVLRHPGRSPRLCVRPLARLRHGRLRMGRRAAHAHAGVRQRRAQRRRVGRFAQAGWRAPASKQISTTTGRPTLNISSPNSDRTE